MGGRMSFIAQVTEQFERQISGQEGAARFMRESAWEAFIANGMPTRRTENWRYTSLKLLDTHSPVDALALPETFNAELFHVITVNEGVAHIPTSLMGIAKWSTDPIPAQIDPVKHPMAVLNLAMRQGGIEITIPAGQMMDKPIALVHVGTAGNAHYFNHRIHVGEGATVSLVSHCFGQSINNILIHADLAAQATFNYYSVNTQQSQAIHIEALHAKQKASSQFNAFVLATGSRLSRVDISTAYLESHASSKVSGIYSVTDKQHVDIHLNAEHIAPHCSSVQSVRGVVDGDAKAVFNGRVCVHQNAMKSNSEQSNHNLLLSQSAEVYTKPELEIYNDDVKCAHGATMGQLDKEALFYLMARGIAEQDALAMLRLAFIDQQFELIQDETLREYLGGLV
jgi:Fe-S cluster assembly protein SufD